MRCATSRSPIRSKVGVHDYRHFPECDLAVMRIASWVTDIRAALSESAAAVSDYKTRSERALNFIVGQVTKETRGKADPLAVVAKSFPGM